MRQLTFTESNIASMLNKADTRRPTTRCDGTAVTASPLAINGSRLGGLDGSDVKRLKELEHENNRLKQTCAGLSVEEAAEQKV